MGQKLRVKEKGAPKKGGGFGDLYLVLYPVAPVGSDPALQELSQSLERFYDPQGYAKNFALNKGSTYKKVVHFCFVRRITHVMIP